MFSENSPGEKVELFIFQERRIEFLYPLSLFLYSGYHVLFVYCCLSFFLSFFLLISVAFRRTIFEYLDKVCFSRERFTVCISLQFTKFMIRTFPHSILGAMVMTASEHLALYSLWRSHSRIWMLYCKKKLIRFYIIILLEFYLFIHTLRSSTPSPLSQVGY